MKRQFLTGFCILFQALFAFGQEKIFFSWDKEGSEAIYWTNPGGTELGRLSGYDFSGSDFEATPVLRPDGKRLAFLRGGSGARTLMTMDPDGSNRQVVKEGVNGYGSLAWSPSGDEILLQNWSICSEDLYAVPALGGDLRLVVNAGVLIPEPIAVYPSWSSTNKIAFIGTYCGNVSGKLYTVDPDGSNLQFIADNVINASWSPDGSRFAIQQYTPGVDRYQIWIMDKDGGNRQQILTPRPSATPSWSPTGESLVFLQSSESVPGQNWELWLMKTDGSEQKKLAESHFIKTPDWGWVPPPSGSLAGSITTNASPVAGVLVKVLDADGLPIPEMAPVLSDSEGHYFFEALPVDDYQVMVVEPLGLTADANPKPAIIQKDATMTVDFALTPVVVSNEARSKGYWKHQFDVYLTGKGNAQESESKLHEFIAGVHQYYTSHFAVFAGKNTFIEWQALLSPTKKGTMLDKAKEQLAALVLNLTSLKIGQYTSVSSDGRTAGDVLTFVSVLVSDGIPDNDELAKDLAEQVNTQIPVLAGVVPEGSILYKGSRAVVAWSFGKPEVSMLHSNYPNPFNPSTEVRFDVASGGDIAVEVFDLLGKKVVTLAQGWHEPGSYRVRWNASGLASGLYVCRMIADSYFGAQKLLLTK